LERKPGCIAVVCGEEGFYLAGFMRVLMGEIFEKRMSDFSSTKVDGFLEVDGFVNKK
jgi:hypothetical protein